LYIFWAKKYLPISILVNLRFYEQSTFFRARGNGLQCFLSMRFVAPVQPFFQQRNFQHALAYRRLDFVAGT
jgi:hypothetical protein